MFETMVNALIMHNYTIFYVDELLLNQKFGDWVKARLIIWYFQFLIIQYEDQRWIEHFQVNRTFVG
jgi:hypothetical protein